MTDEALAAHWKSAGLRAVCAVTTALCRHARSLQRSRETSATLMAQALTAAELLSALQLGKGAGRINLQLECDGPLRGLFADADGTGHLRGYAKNPWVDVRADSAEFRWRPAFGNSGFLSVLRGLEQGDFFRSSVELAAFDFARDLERFFEQSEQVDTAIALEVASLPGEPLGAVMGLAVQRLPDGESETLAKVRAALLAGEFQRAVASGVGPVEVLRGVLPGVEVEITARFPLTYHCECSKERVLRALIALGRAELEDMISHDGKAEVTCQFCARKYEVARAELETLLSSTGD